MKDFLLEIRCEEIPARMQLKASKDLEVRLGGRLGDFGLGDLSIDNYVTPRRLAIIVRDLSMTTRATVTEYKGPRTSAPEQALAGFLRSNNLVKEQLEDRNGIWFAEVEEPGRAMGDLLAEIVPDIIRAFPWPKSMRWGAASQTTESLRWVRPLQGIVAILGEDLVDIEIAGIKSGFATFGHRFHHPGEVTIASASTYAAQMFDAKVIVSHSKRANLIEARAGKLAESKGYSLVADIGLTLENAGLTEWPVPLLGDFDPAFLEVPPEVIQLTLRINQKYFVLRDGAGNLAPAFICTANIDAKDGGAAIIAGNRKVLAARLSDARFFWEQDKKARLEDHAKKLSRITFHEKLGTVADKVERVAKLARWLVEKDIVKEKPLPFRAGVGVGAVDDAQRLPTAPTPSPEGEGSNLATLAEQAARLCKADLVTEMVGEFPELQGIMGGYYARAEGLPDEVADAIRDHYKPVGQDDDVPTAPVTVAVSLADKLDTIGSFFAIGLPPSGSRDPFALRRAALGVVGLIFESDLRFDLRELLRLSTMWSRYAGHDLTGFSQQILDFFADRLKVQQREAGVRHDLIDAVFALGGEDDLVRLLARVHALQAFMATDDGVNLLAGYKRAANILKKEAPLSVPLPLREGPGVGAAEGGLTSPTAEGSLRSLPTPVSSLEGRGDSGLSYTPEPAESALIAALDAAEPRAAQAVAAEEFEGAMAALATLRAPIDAFFDTVTVNDADAAKRAARLALLMRVRDAVHGVADFSKIAG